MPHHIQGLGVFGGEQPQRHLPFGGQRGVGPDQLPVDFGGQRGLGQPRADVGGNVDGTNATREFQHTSVGQNDFKHDLPYVLTR